MALYLKAMGQKLQALMGEITDDREQRKQWAAHRETGRQRKATKKDTSQGSARPTPLKDARETGSRRLQNRRGAQGGCGDGGDGHGGERTISPGTDRGNGVSFLVDTGSGVSILAARTWRKWGLAEDELTRYLGRLCSVEGRAL